jgi:D-sedoheptulose 7-phosphate isomerase
MTDKEFLEDYLDRYKKAIFETDIKEQLIQLKKEMQQLKTMGNKIVIAGNGGSAALASHVAVDFTKQGGIRAVNFNEADLITCFSNDYGYDQWVAKAIEFYGDEGDMVILISSSGKSMNIVNAAKTASSLNMPVVTLTGFESDNPLKQLGTHNLWLDSRAYNVVENTHLIWLLMLCDLIIGEAEYSA